MFDKNLFRKILFTLVLGVALCMSCDTVNAKTNDIFYTNDKGATFTEEQYDFFTRFYWEGYQDYMTQEMVDEFSDIDFANAEISKSSYCPVMPRGGYFESSYKSITLGKTCGAMCRISITVEWFAEPNIKSYDLIGVYMNGPTRISTPSTVLASNGNGYSDEETIYKTDGHAAIIKIPASASDNIVITHTFAYTGSGIIMASYQHAMNTISLANARKFDIDIGHGTGVFAFYDQAEGVYDHFPAVDVTV